MLNKFVIVSVAVLLLVFVSVHFAQDSQKHEHDSTAGSVDDHTGHDHDEDVTHDDHDEHGEADKHEGHDHDAEADHSNETADEHAGHEEHSEGPIVELTPSAVELAGITFSKAKIGRIETTVELPGEIGFNEDRLAHIAPRFAGIALQTKYGVGDYVEEGAVMAVIESNESMNSYSIKTPISGWVIERHVTRGEYVSEENSIYVIADLSTVWVNLAVYPKDANRIKKGQTALIKSIGTSYITTGKIEYVTPIMDTRTRSATARITLSNSGNILRPGTFVQATITTESGHESLVVEKNAVQYLEDKSVVFVADGPDRFKPVEVVLGDSDDLYTQIKDGLTEGVKYVSTGAFELKAKIVTSNLDAHAGHGH